MNYVDSKDREMWKALVTGEKTSIREAYCNEDFNHGLPTIITTNNYKFFAHMLKSDYFKHDCMFSWVKEYLGPVNTKDDNKRKHIECDFDISELDDVI